MSEDVRQALIWAGYTFVLATLTFHGHRLWFAHRLRGMYLIILNVMFDEAKHNFHSERTFGSCSHLRISFAYMSGLWFYENIFYPQSKSFLKNDLLDLLVKRSLCGHFEGLNEIEEGLEQKLSAEWASVYLIAVGQILYGIGITASYLI